MPRTNAQKVKIMRDHWYDRFVALNLAINLFAGSIRREVRQKRVRNLGNKYLDMVLSYQDLSGYLDLDISGLDAETGLNDVIGAKKVIRTLRRIESFCDDHRDTCDSLDNKIFAIIERLQDIIDDEKE